VTGGAQAPYEAGEAVDQRQDADSVPGGTTTAPDPGDGVFGGGNRGSAGSAAMPSALGLLLELAGARGALVTGGLLRNWPGPAELS
jgi:hypothetical protein